MDNMSIIFEKSTKYTVVHPKSDIVVLYQSSVYNETTWSCNMSYERKFCGLSEYVQFTKVKSLIKSTNWPKLDFMCAKAEIAEFNSERSEDFVRGQTI